MTRIIKVENALFKTDKVSESKILVHNMHIFNSIFSPDSKIS